jgi:hypothetical protein
MTVKAGSLGIGRLVGILALVVGGFFLVPFVIDKVGDEATGNPTFKDTLSEVRDDFGDDAGVLSISEIGGTVTYKVIDGSETVRTRTYSIETSEVRGPQGEPAQGRSRTVQDSERPATRKEIRGSKVTLGDLDQDVVVQMWEEVGFPTEGSTASLTGDQWVLSSGARPSDRYLANADGTGIRKAKEKDIFAGSTKDRARSAQSLAKCIQEAGSDIAAIQRCKTTAP